MSSKDETRRCPTSVYPWNHNETQDLNDTTRYLRNVATCEMKQKEVPSRELLVNKSNQNTNSITRDRLTAVYHHCLSTRITSLCSEGGLLTGCPSWRAKNCMVNQVESQPTESTDDAEARADFWSIQGDFIYRHHHEPRVQLHVPKEETFPISYSTGMH